MPPFRTPRTADGDPPDWQPPDYAQPADESSSEEWQPPDYASPVEETKPKTNKLLNALKPAEKIHATGSLIPSFLKPGSDTLNKASDLFHRAVSAVTTAPKFITDPVDKFANDVLDKPSLNSSVTPNRISAGGRGTNFDVAKAQAGAAGSVQAASRMITPVNVALSAIGATEASLVKKIGEGALELIPALTNIQKARQIISIPVAAHGAYNILAPSSSISERLQGIPELAGGIAGTIGGKFARIPNEEMPIGLNEAPRQSREINYRQGGSPQTPEYPARVLQGDIPLERQEQIRTNPDEYGGESIRQPQATQRDFGYSERDAAGPPSELEAADEAPSQKLLGSGSEEVSVPEVPKTEEPTVKQPKPFINPFEKKTIDKMQSDNPPIIDDKGGMDWVPEENQLGYTGKISPELEAFHKDVMQQVSGETRKSTPEEEIQSLNEMANQPSPEEKPLPIRSPNLDPSRFAIGTAETPPAKKNTEDILYDIARNKHKMGQTLPDTKAEFLALNEQGKPMYNIVEKDGTRSTFTGPEELTKRGIAVPKTPTDAVPMNGSEIRAKFLTDQNKIRNRGDWKPPSYAKPPAEPLEERDYEPGLPSDKNKIDIPDIDKQMNELEKMFSAEPLAPKQGRSIGNLLTDFNKLNKHEKSFTPTQRYQMQQISRRLAGALDNLKNMSVQDRIKELSKGDKEPSEMRVRGTKGKSGLENIAIGPEGAENMINSLAVSLYTRNPDVIAAKELLQNALDEHRIIGSSEPVKMVVNRAAKHPITGEDANSTIIQDRGRGLTPEQLYTVFTNLGESGKREESSASGGFGFAKASPLAGGKYIKVESIVNENGKKVKYTFEGDPKTLKNQKLGAELNKEESINPFEKTGFKVEVFYNREKSSPWNVKEIAENMGERSPGTTSDVHMFENYSSDSGDINKFLNDQPMNKYAPKREIFSRQPAEDLVDIIELPQATVNIHYDKPNVNSSAQTYKLHILNKGMWQQTLDKGYGSIHPVAGVPENITADVISKVEEGTEDYPFGLNREQLNENVTKAINDWIKKNVVSGALEKQKNKLQKLYNDMKEFKTEGTDKPTVFYDSGERLTPEERKLFLSSPVTKALAKLTDSVVSKAIDAYETESGNTTWGNRLEKTGLFLGDEGHNGWHVPNPAENGKRSTILINYFSHGLSKSPDAAIKASIVTLLHEVAHIGTEGGVDLKAQSFHYGHEGYGDYISTFFDQLHNQGGGNPGHEVDWLQRLGDVYATYGPDQFEEASDELRSIIKDPKTGEYNEEFQKLLQIYQESRGRNTTEEDILSRTGVKQEPPKRGKGDSSSSNQPNGEGAVDVKGAINKLLEALGSAREGMNEQESINKTERARRFSDFVSVKQGGAAGAAKSLGKLRGEFEKVNPGEGLKLSQKETDILFTAIKQAKITPGEQARGYTALFKIMNGESVPQRNELRILDDVFGSGFADQIINMQGGLGAVGLKVAKVANTMKSLENAMSLAAPLRHGIGLAYRKEFAPAFADMFKFFANKEYYDAAMQAITEGPNYTLKREAGLFTAKPGSLLSSEEEFLNSYAGDIPVARNVVGASQRGYVGFLNKLRDDVSENMLKTAEKLGTKTYESVTNKDGIVTKVPTKETRAIMRFVNTFSGRGQLPFGLEKMTNELNTLLWSPRMMASRVQMFTNPKIYTDLPKGMRLEGLKALLGVAALGTVIDTALSYAGAKISYNILSTDFGKSRFGTKLIDPWGGLQQYVVFAARFLAGKTDSKQPTNRLEIAGRFMANKESPAASLAHELLTAKKFTGKSDDPTTAGNFTDQYGQKTSVQSEAGKRFLPIFVQDINDLMNSDPSFSDNIGLTAIMGVGSLTGMSQEYTEKKAQTMKFRTLK